MLADGRYCGQSAYIRGFNISNADTMLTLGRRIWCDSKMPNGLKNNEDGIRLANDVALAPASPVANHQNGGRKVTVIF